MSQLIPEIILPNGMKVLATVPEEALIIYEQVQEYFQNGIEIHEGDAIFDVGANIGLFTLWAYQKCNQNVNIYAFEPIPAIFNVLKANVQRLQTEKIQVFCYGLSCESIITTFDYYPNLTALSNAFPEDSAEFHQQLKAALIQNFDAAPPRFHKLRWLPRFIRSMLIEVEAKRAFKREKISCQLRKLSEVFREQNVSKIDLLKVDVEKSELDVFLGIEAQDWTKIKQIVAEVHDLDGRVEKISALLKQNGFSKITLEQKGLLKGSNIFNLYALKN